MSVSDPFANLYNPDRPLDPLTGEPIVNPDDGAPDDGAPDDGGPPDPVALPGPVILNMADVEPQSVSWLWPNRFPLGRISLLVGVPGAGKSYLTCDMAARVSTGRDWPDGAACPLGRTLLVSAEDLPAETVRPRLDACGADPSRVACLTGVRHVDPDTNRWAETAFTLLDVRALDAALTRLGDCRLVVIDPIGSFLGGTIDAHRDNAVRAVLAPVAQLAERHGVAVVVVAHRRKGSASGASGSADESAMGSRAFTGLARVAWHLTRDPSDKSRRLLLPGKNNLAPEGHGLAFGIVGQPVGAIRWEPAPVEMSADDALANERDAAGGDRDARSATDAQAWLAELLSDGVDHAVSTVRAAADGAGLAWRTVQAASRRLGVHVRRNGTGGGYVWQCPPTDPATACPF